MLYKFIFFLLVVYEHFQQFFACELVHIMQSNAHIFMCESNTLPANCTIFWTNNMLSFCISNSFVAISNFSSPTNLSNFTNAADFNNFIPPMFPSPTTSLPDVQETTITNTTTTMAPFDNSTMLYNTTAYATLFRSNNEIIHDNDSLIWIVLGLFLLMFLVFGGIWFFKKSKGKNSVLPLFNEEKPPPISKTKIVALKHKPPIPNKYLHVKENLSIKPEFSFEEVVQLKRILSKKKKNQKMKKYVQRLRVLPPIIKSKKVTPSKNGVFLVDHSWKTPPSS